MSKLKPKEQFVDPERGPLVSPRFVVALVLMLAGIAWIAYYYIGVRAPDGFDKETLQPFEATGPKFMQDLGNWNYLIGFGLFFLGLIISAHPSTPLGRGRGVVVAMLACFLVGAVLVYAPRDRRTPIQAVGLSVITIVALALVVTRTAVLA